MVLKMPYNEYIEHNILIFQKTPAQQTTINIIAANLATVLQVVTALYNKEQPQDKKIDNQPGKKLVLPVVKNIQHIKP